MTPLAALPPSVRRLPAAFCAALALGLSGCGRNAFFEIDVVLPANTSGKDLFAIVSFAPGNQDFDAIWAGNQTLDGVKLSSGPTTQHASVESPEGDHFDTSVEVKVSFCGNASCTATGDDRALEARLHVARAFYEGQRTSYTWTIGCLPAAAPQTPCTETDRAIKEVTKCEVAGCREGTSSSYCVGDKHFCE